MYPAARNRPVFTWAFIVKYGGSRITTSKLSRLNGGSHASPIRSGRTIGSTSIRKPKVLRPPNKCNTLLPAVSDCRIRRTRGGNDQPFPLPCREFPHHRTSVRSFRVVVIIKSSYSRGSWRSTHPPPLPCWMPARERGDRRAILPCLRPWGRAAPYRAIHPYAEIQNATRAA
jgi:hypothetical protein